MFCFRPKSDMVVLVNGKQYIRGRKGVDIQFPWWLVSIQQKAYIYIYMHAVTHIFENICKHLLYMYIYIYINYNEFHMWWTCVPSPSLDKEASLNSQTLPGCRQRRRSETGYSSSCWRTMGNAGTKTPTTVESNYCRKLQRKCY